MLTLGADATVVLTETGALLAYVPEAAEVWRVEPTELVVGTRWPVAWGADVDPDDTIQLTAAGENWAVLDVRDGGARDGRGRPRPR